MILDQLFTQDAPDLTETSDYARRREREEAIISGQKPARKRQPAQTSDYARRREQEKKQEQGVAEEVEKQLVKEYKIYKAKHVAWVVSHGDGHVSRFKPHEDDAAKAQFEKVKGNRGAWIAAVDQHDQSIRMNSLKAMRKKQGVAEGHADQQRKIFKKNGKPVGEVGIDRESSPGVGQYYMKCYATGDDLSGYDSYEEAVAELKHCLKQGVAEESDRQFAQRMKKQAEQPPTKGMSQQEKVAKGWAHPDTLKKKGQEKVAKGWAHPDTLKKKGVAEGQEMSLQQLATISDEALDNQYHYGRSTPGNTFGWQANLMSAAYAKRMIDAGVTNIEKIADAIHKGWNVTARKFVANPDQFDDTEKLRQAGKLDAKLQQRAKLMKINYAQLDNDEQEKDRVVARALLQAMRGQSDLDEGNRFDEPLTGYHIVYRKSGQVVHATPSFETQDAAQRYLMTRMFANHQDYRVAHTAQLGLAEDLRKWFREKWVRFNPQGKIMGACARGDDSEGKPKCLPQAKAHALGKAGRASAAARKRREDPNPERRGAAKNVATKEAQLAEKQDACYRKVKSRYKVWPSAYASGALVQCRKKGARNWGNKS